MEAGAGGGGGGRKGSQGHGIDGRRLGGRGEEDKKAGGWREVER